MGGVTDRRPMSPRAVGMAVVSIEGDRTWRRPLHVLAKLAALVFDGSATGEGSLYQVVVREAETGEAVLTEPGHDAVSALASRDAMVQEIQTFGLRGFLARRLPADR